MSNSKMYQLTINNKEFGKVEAPANAERETFIAYVKANKPEFDPTRDTLKVTDVSPAPGRGLIRHPARDKSRNNAMVTGILTRQINNLILTYGNDAVLEVFEDVDWS